jgi:hypothetical protein
MAVLSTAARKKLPSKSFALPGKGEGPHGKGAGSYPIDTPARARNALARGAQHASPEQQATIRRKVKAKYPSIEVSGQRAQGGTVKPLPIKKPMTKEELDKAFPTFDPREPPYTMPGPVTGTYREKGGPVKAKHHIMVIIGLRGKEHKPRYPKNAKDYVR